MPECPTLRLWRHTLKGQKSPQLSFYLVQYLFWTISATTFSKENWSSRIARACGSTEREAQRTDPIPGRAHHSWFSIVHRHVVLQIGVYLLHRDRVIFGIYLPLLWCCQDNRDGLLACFQDNLWRANLCLEKKMVLASSGVKQPWDKVTAQPFLDQRPKTTLLWEILSP